MIGAASVVAGIQLAISVPILYSQWRALFMADLHWSDDWAPLVLLRLPLAYVLLHGGVLLCLRRLCGVTWVVAYGVLHLGIGLLVPINVTSFAVRRWSQVGAMGPGTTTFAAALHVTSVVVLWYILSLLEAGYAVFLLVFLARSKVRAQLRRWSEEGPPAMPSTSGPGQLAIMGWVSVVLATKALLTVPFWFVGGILYSWITRPLATPGWFWGICLFALSQGSGWVLPGMFLLACLLLLSGGIALRMHRRWGIRLHKACSLYVCLAAVMLIAVGVVSGQRHFYAGDVGIGLPDALMFLVYPICVVRGALPVAGANLIASDRKAGHPPAAGSAPEDSRD